MANVQAFGFGGYDYIGSIGEGKISTKLGLSAKKKSNKMDMRYQRAMMEYQQQLQQEQMNFQSALNQKNQIWAANALPEQTVKGLRAANLNPLLAYSDFSGLASSGAMGVSPSSVPGASPGSTVDVDMGDGTTSGFGADAIDRLRYRKKDTRAKELANEQTEAAIENAHASRTKAEAETAKTNVEKRSATVNAEIDEATNSARQEAEMERALAESAEAKARQRAAEKTCFDLDMEMQDATGWKFPNWRYESWSKHYSGPSDDMAEFWNDFYRNKRDLQRYQNSAFRAKALDAVSVGKDVAGAVGSLKGKNVNVHNTTTNNTDNRIYEHSKRTYYKK